MAIIQDIDAISIGPLWVQIGSEELGGCYNLGCLNRANLAVTRAMRTIMCSITEAPAGYFPISPGMGVQLDVKEMSAVNMALAYGPGASLVTSTNIDTMTGNPAAASSVADPCEWHIVKLSAAAGPWNFTLYTENKYLQRAAATFIKGTDIQFYTAANNNGDPNVAAAAWEVTPATHVDGAVTVSDECLGKLTFSALTDTSVTQWTYDASAAPFTVNGTYPIRESDVQHGDTVALIGVAYKWGKLIDAAGVIVPAANQQALLMGNDVTSAVQPVYFRGVHMLSNKSQRRAIVVEMWKATNLSGFSTAFDSMSANDISMGFNYMAQDDKRSHPTSPMGWVRFINSTTDLDPQKLLIGS